MEEVKSGQYMLVEIMGHNRYAGYVTEEVIAGQAFVRVDVPEVPAISPHDDGRYHHPAKPGIAGFTKFFGPGSIYSLTPVSFELCQAAARQLRSEPVSVYIPELYPPEPVPAPRRLTAYNTRAEDLMNQDPFDDGYGEVYPAEDDTELLAEVRDRETADREATE